MLRGDPLLRFRPATPDDALAMAEVSLRAYPRSGDTAAARAQAYGQSVWFSINDYTLAHRDGHDRHVGQYLTLPFQATFGGQRAPASGLASVATLPEARRTGVASAMIVHYLESLLEHGVAWAILYPYSPAFYTKFGWSPMARTIRWELTPAELPLSSERSRVRSLTADAADLARIQRCYERHAARVNGSLSRTPRQLAARIKSSHVAGVATDSGELSGYLVYELRNPTPHPITMVVTEMVAEDSATLRALVGFLAAQDAQVERLELDAAEHDPISHLARRGLPLVEDPITMPNEQHLLGRIFSGAMARVVHLQRALEGRGYPGWSAFGSGAPPPSGRIAIAAVDQLVPGNQQPLTVTVEGGMARVTPGQAAGVPLLRGTIGDLTRVLTGVLRLHTAVHLGLLELEPGGRLHDLDGLLALPPPYPLVTF